MSLVNGSVKQRERGRLTRIRRWPKTFEGKRRFSDAINCYYQALQLNTNSAIVLNRLAWLRATAADPRLRNGEEAVRLAERACRLTNTKRPS